MEIFAWLHVAFFGVPKNMESFLQAVERCGRDGSDALSMIIMFHCACNNNNNNNF